MNEKIIICPSNEKENILLNYEKDNLLHPTKFFTKQEFLNNYYFEYDEKALYYLMDKYNLNIDVAKVYLNNLYFIDLDKKYKNKKLIFLSNLKQELIDNRLLIIHSNFRNYIKNKQIEVKHYYDFDKYLEKVLNINNDLILNKLNIPVYEFQTIEDEVSFVCIKIRELLKQGVDINKIFLSNVSDDYYYTLEKLFSYYKIPINIPFKESIYSTKIVQDYLTTKNIDNLSNNIITKKLINVLGSIIELDNTKEIYNDILVDKLKNTYLNNPKLDNAVNIVDLKDRSFINDEYVFVLGFNLDSLPSTYKDIEFINDKDKEEVDLYKTDYLNIREKEIVTTLLSRINNLTLSYKLSSPFQKYYPSNLIKELGLEVIKPDINLYNYSNLYNKIKLGEMYDKYYTYGEKDEYLELLNNTYNISYNTYNNKYTGIDNNLYLNNIKKPFSLSYTSLNSYQECRFKYYINYVLKINEYEDTFGAYIGSLYHKILSLYQKKEFDFEKEWDKYLETRKLTIKEKVLLVRIKKELLELINILKEQQLLTGYDNTLEEKEIRIKVNNDIDVEFIGYIDKIMYLEKNDNIYYSVVDYKSGTIDTHIEPMKYGLHMQLPIYLYLINYSNIFKNPIFTGIYYQNILFSYPTWKEDLEKEKKDKYMLKGYSTNDTEVLERFDSTFTDSDYIKSMKYDPEKGFSRYAKLINEEDLESMIKYTKNKIEETADEILQGDFTINPKVYGKDNVSCKFCSFKDLCYTTPKDLVYLEKQEDLSFLGGEE